MINLTGTPIEGWGHPQPARTAGRSARSPSTVAVQAGYSGRRRRPVHRLSSGQVDVFQRRSSRTPSRSSTGRPSSGSPTQGRHDRHVVSAINQIYAVNKNPAPPMLIFPLVSRRRPDLRHRGARRRARRRPAVAGDVERDHIALDTRRRSPGTFDWKWLADWLANPLVFFRS